MFQESFYASLFLTEAYEYSESGSSSTSLLAKICSNCTIVLPLLYSSLRRSLIIPRSDLKSCLACDRSCLSAFNWARMSAMGPSSCLGVVSSGTILFEFSGAAGLFNALPVSPSSCFLSSSISSLIFKISAVVNFDKNYLMFAKRRDGVGENAKHLANT